MKDLHEPADVTRYECLTCGYEVDGESSPGDCPECGASLRNRGTPME